MKYHNFLSGKFANIFNRNSNNVKIAFKTKNNSIQTVNNKIKKFTIKNLLIMIIMVITNLFVVVTNFIMEKLLEI